MEDIIKLLLNTLIEEKVAVRSSTATGLAILLEQRRDINQNLSKIIKNFIKEQWSDDGGRPTILTIYFLNRAMKFLSVDVLGDLAYQLLRLLKSNSFDEDSSIHIYLAFEVLFIF